MSKPNQKHKTPLYPLNFVLKYDPPMIGMVYKSSEQDEKKRIYKIYLHDLIYKKDPEVITNQLLLEHSKQLNGANISKKQIKTLIEKLLSEWNSKSSKVVNDEKNLQSQDPRKRVQGESTTANLLNLNLEKMNKNANQQPQNMLTKQQQEAIAYENYLKEKQRYAYADEEEEGYGYEDEYDPEDPYYMEQGEEAYDPNDPQYQAALEEYRKKKLLMMMMNNYQEGDDEDMEGYYDDDNEKFETKSI